MSATVPDGAAAPVIDTAAPAPPARAGLWRRLLREPGTAVAFAAVVLLVRRVAALVVALLRGVATAAAVVLRAMVALAGVAASVRHGDAKQWSEKQ